MCSATRPMDMPERAAMRRRGRWQLALILLVAFGPMLLATSMYHHGFWIPHGRSYHGALIGNGEQRSDIGVRVGTPPPGWQLLVTAPGACDQACEALVYLARQVHVGLGRDVHRASHALATAQPLTPAYQALLARDYPRLQRYPLDRHRHASRIVEPGPQLWIVDPHGNLVLRYDAKVKGRHVLDDLRHLLKLSNIG